MEIDTILKLVKFSISSETVKRVWLQSLSLLKQLHCTKFDYCFSYKCFIRSNDMNDWCLIKKNFKYHCTHKPSSHSQFKGTEESSWVSCFLERTIRIIYWKSLERRNIHFFLLPPSKNWSPLCSRTVLLIQLVLSHSSFFDFFP